MIMYYQKLHWLNVHGENVKKNQNSCSAYQLGQCMRRERERSNECINPRQPSVTPNCPAPTTPSRNVGVVIRDKHDLNVIRVRAAKEKEKENVKPKSKGKEKVTPSGKRMTNACQVAQNDNVISKAALAQRARREREKNEKSYFQCSQREQEGSEECIQLIHPSLAPNRRNRACLEWETITEDSHSTQKQTMVAHHSTCSFSMPSTSLPPQTNRIGSKNLWSLKGQIQLACFDGDVIRLLCMFLIRNAYKLIQRLFRK